MKRCLLPLLCLPLLALADGERLPYTCDNGSRIDISFSTPADGRPSASLHFADTVITLPQVPAASGAAYRQDGIGLHTKDEEAIFEDGKGNLRRCRQGNQAPVVPESSAASSSFLDITGNVSYRVRMALPAGSVLKLRVREGGRTLAEQNIVLDGQQVPIGFQMLVDRDLLGKKPRLQLSARIEHGKKLLFINDTPYSTQQNGSPFEIILKPAMASRK